MSFCTSISICTFQPVAKFYVYIHVYKNTDIAICTWMLKTSDVQRDAHIYIQTCLPVRGWPGH